MFIWSTGIVITGQGYGKVDKILKIREKNRRLFKYMADQLNQYRVQPKIRNFE